MLGKVGLGELRVLEASNDSYKPRLMSYEILFAQQRLHGSRPFRLLAKLARRSLTNFFSPGSVKVP